jgi:hypothetical protein
VLNALGGDCLEDFSRLREDEGLAEMLGHEIPSPEAARKFLYECHDESKLEQAQKELPVGQVSYIAEESAALRALAQVNQEIVQGDRTALCGSEDCDDRSGLYLYRELQTRGAARPTRAAADTSRRWRCGPR